MQPLRVSNAFLGVEDFLGELGFGVPGFKFRVSCSEIRVLEIGYREAEKIGNRVLGIRSRVDGKEVATAEGFAFERPSAGFRGFGARTSFFSSSLLLSA